MRVMVVSLSDLFGGGDRQGGEWRCDTDMQWGRVVTGASAVVGGSGLMGGERW